MPAQEATYSVSALCADLRDMVRALPVAWVAGEAQRLRRSRSGHLYFELVEKGAGDEIIAKLEAVVWRRDLTRIERVLRDVDQRLADGLEIRCRGAADFYPPFGRLQFVVREVDPVFTLGRLSRRRRQTLEALKTAGLLERNRSLHLPAVPHRVALVTSAGSAAYHDFLAALAASGFGFEVLFVHTAVQGAAAEREIVAALETVETLGVDCTVLVRGGGARADLAAFDSRSVAEAVARSPVPVITGLGHEIDEAVADLVAHTRATTPTQAAEVLVGRVRESESRLARVGRRLGARAGAALARARAVVAALEKDLRLATFRTERERQRLGTLCRLIGRSARHRLETGRRRQSQLEARLALAAPRPFGAVRHRLSERRARLAGQARRRLREAGMTVTALDRLCVQLAPERTLRRGFSITRDARGRVLRQAGQVAAGARIVTELADGRLSSLVEE